MKHEEKHPSSGKHFRINFAGDLHAIHDTTLQGRIIRLDDWADRMDQGELSPRNIDALLSFYAHRCMLDFEPLDPASSGSIDFEGVVYGTVVDSIGNRLVERVVLRETELIAV